MKIGALAAAAKVAFLFLLAQSLAAQSAEVKLLSGGGFMSVMNEIAPQFERTSGHKLVSSFESTGALRRQINAGESFDVVLIGAELIEELVKAGKVAPGTRVDVARAGLGVAVRADAPKPDIGSVDAFKRALVNAKTVSYLGEGTGGARFVALLDNFGIAEQMKPKLRPLEIANVVKVVASGEVELVVDLITRILAERGVELVGPLPGEIQSYSGFSAALSAAPKEPEAAKSLMQFLKSDAAAPVIKAKGMETAAP